MMDQEQDQGAERAAHAANARAWLWLTSWPLEVVITRPYQCACADTARLVTRLCVGTVATETNLAGCAYARVWTVSRSRHPGSALEWGPAPVLGHVLDRWVAWHLDTFQLVWTKVDPLRDLGQAIARHPSHGDPCAVAVAVADPCSEVEAVADQGAVDDLREEMRHAVREHCAREAARIKLRAYRSRAPWDGAIEVIDLTRAGAAVETGFRYLDFAHGDPDEPHFDVHSHKRPGLRVEVQPGAPWQWVGRVGDVAELGPAGHRVAVEFSDRDCSVFELADLARAEPGQADPGTLCPRGELQSQCNCEGMRS